MTNRQIVFNYLVLIEQIPMDSPSLKENTRLIATLLLLRSDYKNKFNDYTSSVRDAVKNLKGEGFKKLESDLQYIKSILKRQEDYDNWDEKSATERPVKPTEDELSKIKDYETLNSEYEKELSLIQDAEREINDKKLSEEVNGFHGKISRSDYMSLVECIGTTDTIKIPDPMTWESKEISKVAFLKLVAENLVE